MVEHAPMENWDREQTLREDISAEEIINLHNRYKLQNCTGFIFFEIFSLYKKRMAVTVIPLPTKSNESYCNFNVLRPLDRLPAEHLVQESFYG